MSVEEVENDDLSCIENLASILARIPDQEPPMIKREARYLAINDLGKTVTGVDSEGRKFDGELIDFSPRLGHRGGILLVVRELFYGKEHSIAPQTQITITGKEASK